MAGQGPLLDEPNEKKVVQAVLKNWTSQDDGLSRMLCEVEQAESWRRGERWVFIRSTSNDKHYEIWRPPGVDRLPALPDKVDELCRRVASQMLVDDPILEAEPQRGDSKSKEAAEQASRILLVEGGESGWNFRRLTEGAIDLATTQMSAFAHVTANPVGGGRKPVTVICHPQATQYDPADPAACTLPPMPQPGLGGPVSPAPPATELVTKFLEQDGVTLTPEETATTLRRFVPKIDIKLLGVRNVRFLPEFCRGIEDADGVLVADYISIGELKQRYPETVGVMNPAELRALVDWKPFEAAVLLPEFVRPPKEIGTWIDKEEIPDDAIALVIWEYHRQSPVYPSGAVVCIGGKDKVLCQDTLEAMVERPDGSKVPEVLDVPVSQCRCLNDWVGMRPQGRSLVGQFGPWNEMMAQQWVAVQEFLNRTNNPFTFVPSGSMVQPDQMATRDGRFIHFNPGGQPVIETVPPLSQDVKEFYDRAVAGMNNASGLQEVAQGINTPNINSGAQADTVIQQSLVALASMHANATDFLVRMGRLVLQRLRTEMTVPQTLRYVGDDGSFREQEWRSVDLYSATSVRIARGSFTMMRAEHKRNMILQDVQMGVIPIADAAEMLAENTSEKVGLADDPVRLRIKRQISGCLTRQQPFARIPPDMVPAIAHTRFRELAKAMMEADFSKADPNSQALVAQECEAMRQAAGLLTMQEQSQAAQAAQQAEVQKDVTVENTKADGQVKVAQAKGAVDVAKDRESFGRDLQKMQMSAALNPKPEPGDKPFPPK